MPRAPLARPTDAPPVAHEALQEPPTAATDAPDGLAGHEAAEDLPRHIAIIMDGNRRWARARDLPELDGHAAGVEAIREVLKHAVRRGIPTLTLYAFSRENWARSDDEVDRPVRPARGGDPERDRRTPRPGRPGPAARTPRGTARSRPATRSRRRSSATEGGERLLLNIAFNYAGRTELVDAVRRLSRPASRADEIDEATISGGALHGRPARPRPRHPDRRRAAAVELPHLAVGLRGVLHV